MKIYAFALAATIGIELALVAVLRCFVPQLREHPTLITCACLNLITHPVASFFHLQLSFRLDFVELSVILVEAIGYRIVADVPLKWSVALAVVTNVVSMLHGVSIMG